MFFQLRTVLQTLVLAFLMIFFGFHALTGERGILMARQREEMLSDRQAELKRLEMERQSLEIRARLLRDESLSRDLLEERAQALLGFSGPRDYVIREHPTHG